MILVITELSFSKCEKEKWSFSLENLFVQFRLVKVMKKKTRAFYLIEASVFLKLYCTAGFQINPRSLMKLNHHIIHRRLVLQGDLLLVTTDTTMLERR